ncbi:MAG: biotin--[acetyl-CoA-carboxylase] ligase [Treponemataceae bacterium]|nr:biotin--[acetyl-CoA-carboxylase] ligase [Treponemataceae bacterium]
MKESFKASFLQGSPFFFYDEIDSTNNQARKFAEENPECPMAIFQAAKQTAGRGRLGRSFFSPESGIYISYLMDLSLIKCPFDWITPLASLAVSNSIEKFRPENSEKCKIKWVNDIFLDQKKVSGILSEGYLNPDSNKLEKVIIGIGINLSGQFPDELKEIATSCGIAPEKRQQVVEELSENLLKLLQSPESDFEKLHAEYKNRSILIGRQVKVVPTVGIDSTYTARVLDINEKCHLLVQKIDEDSGIEKEIHEVFTGEVSIRF